jgi:hypothetical protein
MHRLTFAAALSLAMLACTAPNPGAALDLEPDDYAEAGAVADAAGDDATRADDGDVPEDDAVPIDNPAACDGPSERSEFPTCHGGTMERTADGEIVCHWPCIGHAEITAVAVEAAPGCYVLDDMICHQCTDELPSSWEPSGMPCPDVVRLLW